MMHPRERRKLIREEMRRRWYRSPWRLIPQPVLAYIAGGLYLWYVETPDAWLRALGPVIIVSAYLLTRPPIEHAWRKHMRPKVEGEIDERIARGDFRKKDADEWDDVEFEP